MTDFIVQYLYTVVYVIVALITGFLGCELMFRRKLEDLKERVIRLEETLTQNVRIRLVNLDRLHEKVYKLELDLNSLREKTDLPGSLEKLNSVIQELGEIPRKLLGGIVTDSNHEEDHKHSERIPIKSISVGKKEKPKPKPVRKKKSSNPPK